MYTVCKGRVYQGSTGQGLSNKILSSKLFVCVQLIATDEAGTVVIFTKNKHSHFVDE